MSGSDVRALSLVNEQIILTAPEGLANSSHISGITAQLWPRGVYNTYIEVCKTFM